MESRNIYFDDTCAHYAQAGEEGPAVIFLHGWAASLKQWEWLLPIVAEAGYTAYALDLLGHGHAPRPAQGYSIEGFLDYLHRWMKALNICNPVFLGHSMGGYFCLQYVLDHPGAVHALILVDPLYSPHQFDNYHQIARLLLSRPEMLRVGEFAYRLVPSWLIEAGSYWGPGNMDGAARSLRRQLALDHKRADPRILKIIAVVGDLRPRLREVKVPTLVTWGGSDQLLSPSSFEKLVDLLPAVRGYRFADVGHHPHLTHSQSFAMLIRDFLGQIQDDSWRTG